MANAKLICALLLCMVLSAPMLNVEASVPCHTVARNVQNCFPYLRKGGRVSRDCCNAVRFVNNSARTTKDRRDTCKCLKSLFNQVGGLRVVNARFAAALPGICKVKVPYRISNSINCSRIK
ncbi:unnamed protein product [Dovyalis caffra]|uniref:Non-specific lipid-transfer protein n=1 Tax=Dovyalis caffra TaxID=77055 RepID=A0AAV1S457_9ROSI|nr:unnamed protein product [Dovyalis caffra]